MFQATIAAIFPAFNEQDNLERVIQEAELTLSNSFLDYRIVIVNDGSTDQTQLIAENLKRNNNKIIVVTHAPNRGYGAALRSGFEKSLVSGMEWIFFTDSDGQFHFPQVIQFIEKAQQTNQKLIIGYRTKRADSWSRKVNGWCWTVLNCCLFGFWVKDLDCAFKLIHSQILNDFHYLQGEAATINPELLIKSKQLGYTFIQLPVIHRPRLAGIQTGANFHVVLKSFVSLFRLWINIRYHPKLSERIINV